MSKGQEGYDAVYAENARLRSRIVELEQALRFSQAKEANTNTTEHADAEKTQTETTNPYTPHHNLTPDEMVRYSRHLILPEIGVEMQAKWSKNSRVLVIGAGGLGAPVILYLATAGVGKITIVDDDVVDVSNLQRQVIHTEGRVGQLKAESARIAALERNSLLDIVAYSGRFTAENALQLALEHDVLIDATDNVATRYLINDAGVIARKPIISGSALRMEGQLTVYNYKGGPCYRCLFPIPPPAETVTNCSDGGVLGVVPGIIGVTQALETLKVLADQPKESVLAQRLLVLDAASGRFRTLSLRPRNPACAVCGDAPSIVSLDTKTHDVNFMCPALKSDRVEDQNQNQNQDQGQVDNQSEQMDGKEQKVCAEDASKVKSTVRSVPHIRAEDFALRFYVKDAESGSWRLKINEPVVILDVREPVQHKICSLPGDINVPRRLLGIAAKKLSSDIVGGNVDEIRKVLESEPLKQIFDALKHSAQYFKKGEQEQKEQDKEGESSLNKVHLVAYCRRGLDSVLACKHLETILEYAAKAGYDLASKPLNLAGGVGAFMRHVDSNFPLY